MVDSPNSDRNGLLADIGQGDNAPPLSVSEISNALKRTVEERFGYVRLRGEISGYKRAASGHVYLALKDDKAVLDAVMWKGNAGRLAFAPEDGVEVIVTGKLTTYPGRSKYQIVVDKMELAGEGALMQLFEKLKAKLQSEGLFDPSRKRRMPFLPQTIGVVTSPTGAVIRDILHRLSDRCPSRVILWPTVVQGDGAADKIAAAINGFSSADASSPFPKPDLLIVARGGGSIEDLWSFNEEQVVRAVADCSIPVISAVGHETDTTLCDFAADLRAPTPTAAAEMAVPVKADLMAHLTEQGLRIERGARRVHNLGLERLEAQKRLMPRLADLLQPQQQRTDDMAGRLRRGLGKRLSDAGGQLARSTGALRPAMLHQHLARSKERLDNIWRLAAQLHPDKPLQRGFARVGTRDGKLVSSTSSAKAAHAMALTFADGSVNIVMDDGGAVPRSEPKSKVKRAKAKGAGNDRQHDLF